MALLSHTTSSLHSLAIRLSHKAASSLHYNRRTAIPAYPRACLRAVSLSPTFSTYVAALNSTLAKPLSLPALQSLHIDAADNVSSLLRLAPNLVTLGLSIPEGFSETACAQLVRKDLKLVPKLQSLALSPFSLRLPERRASVCYSSPFASSEWRIAQMQAAANRSSTTTGGTGVALVEEIAKSLPELHALDLQTTSYSFSTSRLALQSIPCSAEQHPALLTALQLFTRLRDLALPIDLFPNQRHTFSSTSDDKPYSIPEDEIEAVRSFVHAVPTLAHFSWAGNAPDVPESFIVAYDITSPSNEDVSIVRLSAPSSLRITATPITEEPTTVVEPTTPTSALSKAKDAAWGVVFSAAMVYSSVGRILAPPVIDLAAPRLPRRWSWSSKSSPTASSTLVPRRASLLLPVA